MAHPVVNNEATPRPRRFRKWLMYIWWDAAAECGIIELYKAAVVCVHDDGFCSVAICHKLYRFTKHCTTLAQLLIFSKQSTDHSTIQPARRWGSGKSKGRWRQRLLLEIIAACRQHCACGTAVSNQAKMGSAWRSDALFQPVDQF